MPQPEGVQLTQSISPLLTNIALGFLPRFGRPTSEGGLGFIAKQVFPNVPVAAPAGKFNVWKRGDFLRRQMKKLANFEAAPLIGFTTTQASYSVDKYGIATLYTAMDLANARIGGTPTQQFINNKTLLVTSTSVLELEMQTADLIQTAANWTTQITGVTSGAVLGTSVLQWDQAAADPIQDIDALTEIMRLLTGFAPNTMIMPIQVFNALRKSANLIDRIKYGGTMDRPTEVTLQQMEALFRKRLLIPEGVYNTAKEGATVDAVFDYIWGKKVWLGYVAPMAGIDLPSAGYSFSWTGDVTAGLPVGIEAGPGPNAFGSVKSAEGLFIREYTENRPQGRYIESELFTTPNVVAADLGALISAVIA